MKLTLEILGQFVPRLQAAGISYQCHAPAVNGERVSVTLWNRDARGAAYQLAQHLVATSANDTGAAQFMAALNLHDGELNQTDPDQLMQELNDAWTAQYLPKLAKLVDRSRSKGWEVRLDKDPEHRMAVRAVVVQGNLLPNYLGDSYLNEEREEQYDVAADAARWL